MMGWMACIVLLATDKWLLGVSFFVLLVAVHVFGRMAGPPVILAAFLYQWLQVTIAPIYSAIFGGHIREMRSIDYRPMVIIGLIAVICYFGGYWAANREYGKRAKPLSQSSLFPLPIVTISYFSAIAISITIQRIAWSYPQLTQLLLVLSYVRYVLLFVLISRLMRPKPQWSSILFILSVELVMGFTGYFATFRESLVFIALAIGGAARPRRASTWLSYALVGSLAFGAALVWTAIKPVVRESWSNDLSTTQRLDNVTAELGPAIRNAQWEVRVDELISRMWMIYYPTLAYERVPSTVPFEGGKLLRGAVLNVVMPRMFFPDKGILPSESDKVRKYAGIWVAGRESKTSFAFGYAAESYVDFGVPWMFAPIFVFGALLGLGDKVMRKVLRNNDLRNGVRVVVLWSSMYLYEQSWVIMLGMSIGLFIMLVASGVAFERALHLVPEDPNEGKVRLPIPRRQTQRRQLSIGGRIQPD